MQMMQIFFVFMLMQSSLVNRFYLLQEILDDLRLQSKIKESTLK